METKSRDAAPPAYEDVAPPRLVRAPAREPYHLDRDVAAATAEFILSWYTPPDPRRWARFKAVFGLSGSTRASLALADIIQRAVATDSVYLGATPLGRLLSPGVSDGGRFSSAVRDDTWDRQDHDFLAGLRRDWNHGYYGSVLIDCGSLARHLDVQYRETGAVRLSIAERFWFDEAARNGDLGVSEILIVKILSR